MREARRGSLTSQEMNAIGKLELVAEQQHDHLQRESSRVYSVLLSFKAIFQVRFPHSTFLFSLMFLMVEVAEAHLKSFLASIDIVAEEEPLALRRLAHHRPEAATATRQARHASRLLTVACHTAGRARRQRS